MNTLPFVTIASLAFSAAPGLAKDLIIGVSPDYPPYYGLDATGQPFGLDHEILEYICTGAPYRCSFSYLDIPDLIPALLAGQIDVIAGGMGNLPSRELVVDFSCPHDPVNDRSAIVIGRDAQVDLTTARIAVVEGTTYALEIARLGYTTVLTASEPEAIAAFARGQADAYVGSPNGIDYASQIPGLIFEVADEIEMPPSGAAFAVREEDTALLAHINATVADLANSGELQQLHAQFFTMDDGPRVAGCHFVDLTS